MFAFREQELTLYMTSSDPLIQALAGVTFPPGTSSKRFVRDMASRSAEYRLSDKAVAFAWAIAYRYRRQLPPELSTEALARKRNHALTPSHNKYNDGYCTVCMRDLPKREFNAPCPGPPAQPLVRHSRRDDGLSECGRHACSMADDPQNVNCKLCLRSLAVATQKTATQQIQSGPTTDNLLLFSDNT